MDKVHKSAEEILSPVYQESGLYFNENGGRMLIASKVIKAMEEYASQKGNVWVRIKKELEEMLMYELMILPNVRDRYNVVEACVKTIKNNIEWLDEQPQATTITEEDATVKLLHDIISWEKDLSEYMSLEGILRERYKITKR